jgi:hypothetical protein
MEQHQQVILTMLRSAMFGAPLEVSPGVDWDAVYAELQTHGIAYLVNSTLPESNGPSDELSQRWSYYTFRNIRRFYHVMQEQCDLLALLQQHGIPAVVLKGASAAIYYPNPDGRMMGDIDLLVSPEKAEEALGEAIRQINLDLTSIQNTEKKTE